MAVNQQELYHRRRYFVYRKGLPDSERVPPPSSRGRSAGAAAGRNAERFRALKAKRQKHRGNRRNHRGKSRKRPPITHGGEITERIPLTGIIKTGFAPDIVSFGFADQESVFHMPEMSTAGLNSHGIRGVTPEILIHPARRPVLLQVPGFDHHCPGQGASVFHGPSPAVRNLTMRMMCLPGRQTVSRQKDVYSPEGI